MMDLALRAARRPLPGETIVGTSFDMFLGGKGFNQAVAASRAGASTAMIGRLGSDDFGGRFLEALRAERIDCTHVMVDPEVGTGIGAPLIEESGENSIVIVPRANERLTPEDIECAAHLIAGADVLVLQMELPFDTTVAAARIAQRFDTLVLVNPAPAPLDGMIDELRGYVDILVPNEIEARTLSGVSFPESDLPVAATELSERMGGIPVVVTLGGQGCIAVADGASFTVHAHAVPVLDTVGAGDAFCGALASWLSHGTALQDAVVYANAAGALAVTLAGAEPAMPTRQAIVELAEAADRPAAVADEPVRLVTP